MEVLMERLRGQKLFQRNDMKKFLDKKWKDILAEFPESGMGYQKVKIIFKNGIILKNIFIHNGQECDLPEEYFNDEIEDIVLEN